MSQRSIMCYMKATPPRNGLKRLLETESKEPDLPKKIKSSQEDCLSNDPNHVAVSRVEENRLKALVKLQSKRTPALSPNIGLSWFKALENEFKKPYFGELSAFIEKERKSSTIYPPLNDVFTWTCLCNIENVKVVILGQDPYHGPGQAHGLAFSVPVGVTIPPSLCNMYKELTSDIPGFQTPSHGFLKGWATQGVLLLNACLTVRSRVPNSHSNHGWEKFTDATIQKLNDTLQNVVFLLWGAYAQKKRALINEKKHLVLVAPHPSPLSASRGFFGCRHFSSANDYLIKHHRKPINWAHLPTE